MIAVVNKRGTYALLMRASAAALLAAILMLTAGCGLKGDLYLEEDNPQSADQTPAEQSPQPANTEAAPES